MGESRLVATDNICCLSQCMFVSQCVFVSQCSGSRGLGHQVATDALQSMEKAMDRDGIKVNDRQLACARIHSQEGQVITAQ